MRHEETRRGRLALSHAAGITVLVGLGHAACAGMGGSPALPHVPAPPAASVERVNESRECDAWFSIGGSFVFALNDLHLTLSNRSSDARCVATRVQWLFESSVPPSATTITTPATWTSDYLPCGDRPGTCGVEWRATDTGVLPGQDLSGFGLRYNPLNTPRPTSWVVHVGERQVEMPIGAMGSRLGRVDE